MESLATIIGLVGVATLVAAYGLVSVGRITSVMPVYQWLNIVGTLGILVSVIYAWNLPAFVGQCLWIVLSVVGLMRIYAKRKAS
jgi:hypothetical protein